MIIKEFDFKDWNGFARYVLKVNGCERVWAGCLSECPEDAMLERDLNYVYSILPLMKEAYEAGKNGEEFIIEYIHCDPEKE